MHQKIHLHLYSQSMSLNVSSYPLPLYLQRKTHSGHEFTGSLAHPSSIDPYVLPKVIVLSPQLEEGSPVFVTPKILPLKWLLSPAPVDKDRMVLTLMFQPKKSVSGRPKSHRRKVAGQQPMLAPTISAGLMLPRRMKGGIAAPRMIAKLS
jgi:hypothetical protein